MSEIWDTPPPTNREPKNQLFGQIRNLMATLTAYIFGRKLDIDNRLCVLTTTRVSYIVPKVMNFGPQTASNSTAIFTRPP